MSKYISMKYDGPKDKKVNQELLDEMSVEFSPIPLELKILDGYYYMINDEAITGSKGIREFIKTCKEGNVSESEIEESISYTEDKEITNSTVWLPFSDVIGWERRKE